MPNDPDMPPGFKPRLQGVAAVKPSNPAPTEDLEVASAAQTEAMNLRNEVITDALRGMRRISASLLERALGIEDISDAAITNARTQAAKAFIAIAMAEPRAAGSRDDDVLGQLAEELRARKRPEADDEDGGV